MGRALRVAPAGGSFHVVTRGNRRQPTYLDDIDFGSFLSLLTDVIDRFEWSVLAYCLMRNHYHLVVHTPAATLSAGMQRLNGVYAQRFNWRHGYEGHLFERPFRSVLAKSEDHLKTQIRYAILNPVRAGICAQPGQWPWSSYRASAGHVPAPALLDVDRLAGLFGGPSAIWRVRFAEFIADGIGGSTRVVGPGPETRPEGALRAGVAHGSKRRTTMQALWPPKPNEFESATSMSGASRASFGM